VLHVMRDTHPLILGDAVTIGHGAVLHGCTIESRCLIGMGSIILNGAKIGSGSLLAAGTLVPEGTDVPPGSLFMGHPGKFRRSLTDADQASIDAYAERYVEYKDAYKAEPGNGPFAAGISPHGPKHLHRLDTMVRWTERKYLFWQVALNPQSAGNPFPRPKPRNCTRRRKG